MSYNELTMALEAHKRRSREMMEVLAWHAANQMNIHLPRGRKVKPRQMLGQDKVMFASSTHLREHMRSRQAELDASGEDGR